MAKYINTESSKIMFIHEGQLRSLNPGEELNSKNIIVELSKYLVDDCPPKKEEDDSWQDLKDNQKSELPEDFYVVIEDSLVEELKKESKPKSRRSRRTPK